MIIHIIYTLFVFKCFHANPKSIILLSDYLSVMHKSFEWLSDKLLATFYVFEYIFLNTKKPPLIRRSAQSTPFMSSTIPSSFVEMM